MALATFLLLNVSFSPRLAGRSLTFWENCVDKSEENDDDDDDVECGDRKEML